MKNKDLKVGDLVLFQGVRCIITVLNGDETFRMKSETSDNEYGCFFTKGIEKKLEK